MIDGARFISLPSPKYGPEKRIRFALIGDKLLELQRALENPSSWFVNESVVEDGTVFFGTPFDVRFALLPLLERSRNASGTQRGYYAPLHDILLCEGFPHVSVLADIKPLELQTICDAQMLVQGESSSQVYRLNDEKTLAWLQSKVSAVKAHLSSLPAGVATSVVSVSSFRRNSRGQAPSEEQLLKASLGFLSEYVSASWLDRLAQLNGMDKFEAPKLSATDLLFDPTSSVSDTRPRSFTATPAPKKQRRESKSVGVRQLEKVDTKNIKPLTSFFKPAKK